MTNRGLMQPTRTDQEGDVVKKKVKLNTTLTGPDAATASLVYPIVALEEGAGALGRLQAAGLDVDLKGKFQCKDSPRPIRLVGAWRACQGRDHGADAMPDAFRARSLRDGPLIFLGCGSGEPSASMAPDPPASFDERLLRHLSDGLGDRGLALAPPRAPADEVDSLLVLVFGNRVGADGAITPGPTNRALAAVVAALLREHQVPVYAQWEVGDLLLEHGLPGVRSIGVTTDEHGQVVYLSTAGVVQQAVELVGGDAAQLGKVGVVAFADHAVRSVLTARAAGMDAAVPDSIELPATYDPESGQAWTRDRLTYLSIDLPARLAFAR